MSEEIVKILRNEAIAFLTGNISLDFASSQISEEPFVALRVLKSPKEPDGALEGLLVSLRFLRSRIGFLVAATPSSLRAYYLLRPLGEIDRDQRPAVLRDLVDVGGSIIRSKYPGLEFKTVETADDLEYGFLQNLAQQTPHIGMLTGIPTSSQGQLDRIVGGARDDTWWLLTSCFPVSNESMVDTQSVVRDELQEVTPEIETDSSSSSSARVDLVLKHAAKALGRELERLESGIDLGMWRTRVFFGANSQSTYLKTYFPHLSRRLPVEFLA